MFSIHNFMFIISSYLYCDLVLYDLKLKSANLIQLQINTYKRRRTHPFYLVSGYKHLSIVYLYNKI